MTHLLGSITCEMENATFSRKVDQPAYSYKDFEDYTEARCCQCDILLNVHKYSDHLKECFSEKAFKCKECFFECNHEVNLRAHNLLKHSTNDQRKCTICKKKFKRDAAFRGHVVTHQLLDTLKCKMCQWEFENPVELNRHCRLSHTDTDIITEAVICCLCGEIFSPQDILLHNTKHSYERILQKKSELASKKNKKKLDKEVVKNHVCPECSKAFRRPKELERHKAVHSDNKKWKCNLCDKSFRHENSYRVHEKIHQKTNKIFTCRMCKMEFLTKFNLYRHVDKNHISKDKKRRVERIVVEHLEEVGTIPNELVPFEEYSNEIELVYDNDGGPIRDDEWIDNDEEGEENRVGVNDEHQQDYNRSNWNDNWVDLDDVTGGDLAEQLFENRQSQKEKILIIPENCLRCPACFHVMKSIDHLISHFESLISKDISHKKAIFHCPFCTFGIKGTEVVEHLTLYHGMIPQSSNSPSTVECTPRPRPFKCLQCYKTFTKKCDLSRHIMTHTGEKPFCCVICGMRFRLDTTLRRHEKATHPTSDMNDRMKNCHQCTICNKGFYSRNALRTHMISHSTTCSICPLTFKCATDRNEHMNKDHCRYYNIESSSRDGGMYLPCMDGGMDTLSKVSRINGYNELESSPSTSAFTSIPSSSRVNLLNKKKDMMNITTQRLNGDDHIVKISNHNQYNNEIQDDSIVNESNDNVRFSLPYDLLSSLEEEKGILRTPLNDGRIVSVHPSQTLSALSVSSSIHLHPSSSSSSNPPNPLRSSSFVPIHIESDELYIDHCNICNISFTSKEQSDTHMRSDDHETASLLAPHSQLDSCNTHMVCKLCGNRFVSMELLVDHIRREHERDHPKSLAPLNIHSSILSSNT